MRHAFLSGALAVMLLFQSAPLRAGEPSPVVVELFTSQGCSSCPPADAYLVELARRPDVLPLSIHVDYWNYIGWTDPFASKQATQRQKDYSRSLGQKYVYTPEIVINGAAHEVGSDREACNRLIESAKMRPSGPTLTVERGASGVSARVSGSAEHGPATLWLVRYEPEHTTRVLRGENGGRELRNVNVVREWRELGTWTGKEISLPLPGGDDGRFALILQAEGTGPILAAAVVPPSR
jgi:hypothetical protein